MAERQVEGEQQQAQEAPVATPSVASPVAPTTTFGGAGGAGAIGAALRDGTMEPSSVLTLQRAAGNQAIARQMLMRDPPAAAPPAPAGGQPTQDTVAAFTYALPEQLFDKLKLEAGKASYVKGSLGMKGEIVFTPVDTGVKPGDTTVGVSTESKGVKTEIALEAPKWAKAFAESVGFESLQEAVTAEAGAKKLEVSLGMTGKMKSQYPWAFGSLEGKAVALSVEWAKLSEVAAGAIEIAGHINGEGKVTIGGTDWYVKPKLSIVGQGGINWAKVAAEVAKQGIKEGAKEGAKAAVRAVGTEAGATILVTDMAAVGSAVAAIAVPVAAAVAMGYGAFQAMKNAKSAQDASGQGVVLRDKANLFAKNYAKTLTGSGNASGEGAADAEAQIAAIMAEHNAPREAVIAMVKEKRGGYEALRQEALEKIRPRLYDEAVKAFDESHQDDFGLIEGLGDMLGTEMGMKHTFRSTLRMVLFSDTAVGGG